MQMASTKEADSSNRNQISPALHEVVTEQMALPATDMSVWLVVTDSTKHSQ